MEQQNSAFFDKVSTLRERLPDWMEYTLLGVYFISAGVGALFLTKLLYPSFQWWGVFFAIAVAASTQVVRLIVVFFDQLNPQRPALTLTKSYIAALGLGGLAVYEAIELTASLSLHNAVTISIAGLMLVGIVIELYVLRELQHATNYHFFSNPEALQKLVNFYQEKAGFEATMKQLKRQIATGRFAAPTLPQQQPTPAPQPAPQPTNEQNTFRYTMRIWEALGMAHALTPKQLEEINNGMRENLPEEETLKMIEAYSILNKNKEKATATATSMRQSNATPTLSPLRKILKKYFEENDVPIGIMKDYMDHTVSDERLGNNLIESYFWWDMPEALRERVSTILLPTETKPFEMDFSKNGNGVHH